MQDSGEIVNAVKAVVLEEKDLKKAIGGHEAEALELRTAEMGSDWGMFQESPIRKCGHNKEKI